MSVDPTKVQPQITVVTVGTTETTHTFSAHLKAFQVTCKTRADIRYSWEEDGTDNSGNFSVLYAGASWWEDSVYSGGTQWVLYLKRDSGSGNVEVSIQEWS